MGFLSSKINVIYYNSTAPPTLTISTIILYNYISTVFFFTSNAVVRKIALIAGKNKTKFRVLVRDIFLRAILLTIRKEH